MKAADIMTRRVISVTPHTSVQDTARLLLTNGISAMPVLDEADNLVGIISEGDLMRRPEAGTERRRAWWLTAFSAAETLAEDYIRSHGRRVDDIMTRRVITATPDTPVHELADLLERNGIKRVPIVESRRVVGIVSRANLLQALASLSQDAEPTTSPDDKTLQDRVMREIESEPWGRAALVNVIAHDGTIDLWGMVDTSSEKDAMRIAAETTPGVRAVNDNLVVRPVMMAG